MGEAVVLAVEVGGTNTRLQLVNGDGDVVMERQLRTECVQYRMAITEIAKTALEMATGDYYILQVGVSIAGLLHQGVIVGAGNLTGWIVQDIEGDLNSLLKMPVITLNDAQAAAVAEAKEYQDPFIYVCWGSGIGGALVFDANTLPYATELGHIVIDLDSTLRCGCGGLGHWEALCSGKNIPKRRFGRRVGIEAKDLSDTQWSEVLRDMAAGLRSVSNMMPGAPIIIGGGVPTYRPDSISRLQSLMRTFVSSTPPPTLRPAYHETDSGLIGVALAAWQARDRRSGN